MPLYHVPPFAKPHADLVRFRRGEPPTRTAIYPCRRPLHLALLYYRLPCFVTTRSLILT